jgi:hypothetical protein
VSGLIYAIDMNSVSQNINGTAVAVTCIVDNDTCPPWNMSRFHFDCRGHYKDLDRHGPVMIAPPRSVAGQMAALACAGAKDTRLADDSENARTVRRPLSTDYCVDFTSDACERIKKVVEAYKPSQPPPSYCKPGFALVGSGLTDEQLRICYVITGFKRDTQNARSPKLVAASVVTAPEKTVETVIAHWSGKGNGKSGTFHIKRGTWEFCVTSTRSISGGIYKAADRTGVSAFGFQEPGDRLQLTSTGSFYFVVKTEGNWDITVVSLFPKVQ